MTLTHVDAFGAHSRAAHGLRQPFPRPAFPEPLGPAIPEHRFVPSDIPRTEPMEDPMGKTAWSKDLSDHLRKVPIRITQFGRGTLRKTGSPSAHP